MDKVHLRGLGIQPAEAGSVQVAHGFQPLC